MPRERPEGRHKRLPAEIEEDLVLISKWLTEGKYHSEIATELGKIRPYKVCRQQINYDVKKLKARWLKESMENIGALKADQLRALRERQRDLYESWSRSKQDAVKQTAETVDGDGQANGRRQKKSMTKQGQCGDAAFMRLILEIDDRIARLLGLDAPTTTVLTGADGGPVQVSTEPVVIIEANGFEANDTTRITKAEECPNSEPK